MLVRSDRFLLICHVDQCYIARELNISHIQYIQYIVSNIMQSCAMFQPKNWVSIKHACIDLCYKTFRVLDYDCKDYTVLLTDHRVMQQCIVSQNCEILDISSSEIANLQRQLQKRVYCYWDLHTPAFCAVAWQPSCHRLPGIAEQPTYAKTCSKHTYHWPTLSFGPVKYM